MIDHARRRGHAAESACTFAQCCEKRDKRSKESLSYEEKAYGRTASLWGAPITATLDRFAQPDPSPALSSFVCAPRRLVLRRYHPFFKLWRWVHHCGSGRPWALRAALGGSLHREWPDLRIRTGMSMARGEEAGDEGTGRRGDGSVLGGRGTCDHVLC